MGADQNIDWQAAAASALEWWHDAGVDTLTDETARDWTAVPVTAKRAAAAAAVAEAEIAPLPATLAGFEAWRTGPDVPEAGWPGTPIAAVGDAASAIMVLVDLPDREDVESGTLLSGAAGRLFDRMLAAIGRTRADIYLAPLCTARPIAGRVAPEIEARLGELARHHVALVAPQRLLLLGNAASRALTGADVPRGARGLQSLNLDAGQGPVTVATVASFHPRLLLERPTEKARAWKDLQMLVAGLDA